MNRDETLLKLKNIHSKLIFQGNLNLELPEQIMAISYIKPNDCVLELGGSCGRASCVINHILLNKKNHVVIEPSTREINVLTSNRNNNNFKFQIENSAISHKPLFSKEWHTVDRQIPNSVPVNVITYNQLKEKYNLNFNVLVIDNEGNFVDMLKKFPNILIGIRLLQIEHDFNSEKDLEYFYKTMSSNNFRKSEVFLKTEKYGPGQRWPDGIRSDPIFVSVWEK